MRYRRPIQSRIPGYEKMSQVHLHPDFAKMISAEGGTMNVSNFAEDNTSAFYTPDKKLFDQFSMDGAAAPEIAIRETAWDYYRVLGYLPNPDKTLRALQKDIDEYEQLLADPICKAAMNSRRAGTLSLSWDIEQGGAPSRMYKTIKSIFDSLDIPGAMGDMLLGVFYGYALTEVLWKKVGSLIVPEQIVPKPQRWFRYSDINELRYLTKRNMITGEPCPERKFIATRYHPTYTNPYGESLGGACYWPIKWRHASFKFWMTFVEKYGIPWTKAKYPLGTQAARVQEMINMIATGIQDNVFAYPSEFEIETMAMSGDKTSSSETFKAFIEICDKQIEMAILGQTLTSEVGSKGSYAAAKVHHMVRQDLIEEDKRMVEEAMNTLIDWICYYNFSNVSARPRFKLIEAPAPDVDMGQLAVYMTQAGVSFTKDYWINRFGLTDDEFDVGPSQAQGAAGTQGEPGEPGKPVPKSAAGTEGKGTDSEINKAAQESHDPSRNTGSWNATARLRDKKPYGDNSQYYGRLSINHSEPSGTGMIFVRHGETVMNVDGDRIRGWSNPPLDEEGLLKAQQTALELVPQNIDLIVSSDLLRATETAECISRATGASVSRCADLRPWNVGIFTGKPAEEVMPQIAPYVDDPDKPVPAGESFGQFRARVINAVQKIHGQYPDKKIALVAHHRNDRLMAAWEAKGCPSDLSIDKNEFLTKGIKPGTWRIL